jgi:hypothetical protein
VNVFSKKRQRLNVCKKPRKREKEKKTER